MIKAFSLDLTKIFSLPPLEAHWYGDYLQGWLVECSIGSQQTDTLGCSLPYGNEQRGTEAREKNSKFLQIRNKQDNKSRIFILTIPLFHISLSMVLWIDIREWKSYWRFKLGQMLSEKLWILESERLMNFYSWTPPKVSAFVTFLNFVIKFLV